MAYLSMFSDYLHFKINFVCILKYEFILKGAVCRILTKTYSFIYQNKAEIVQTFLKLLFEQVFNLDIIKNIIV